MQEVKVPDAFQVSWANTDIYKYSFLRFGTMTATTSSQTPFGLGMHSLHL